MDGMASMLVNPDCNVDSGCALATPEASENENDDDAPATAATCPAGADACPAGADAEPTG
jgi:hypothetical protein